MSDATEHVVTLRVDPQHPVFAGHFPGRPIVPGVLLIDWALAALQDVFPEAALPGELGTVKFLQPVLPGAELRIVGSRTARGLAIRIESWGQSGVRASSDPTLTPGLLLVASATLNAGGAR